MPNCRSCGAEIIWIEMASGKTMPVDPKRPMLVWCGRDGNQPGEVKQSYGYTPHWVTCPDAKEHRQPKQQPLPLGPVPAKAGEPKKKDEDASRELPPIGGEDATIYGGTQWQEQELLFFQAAERFCETTGLDLHETIEQFFKYTRLNDLKYLPEGSIRQLRVDLEEIHNGEHRMYRTASGYPALEALQVWFAFARKKPTLPVRAQIFWAYKLVKSQRFTGQKEAA